MKIFKKIGLSVLLSMLILAVPTSMFASPLELSTQTIENQNGEFQPTLPLTVETSHQTFKIPLTVEDSTVNSSVYGDMSPQALEIVTATVDWGVKTYGNLAVGDWTITMDDTKFKITQVYISIVWSNGETDPFRYPTYGVPTHVSNQGETTYSEAGQHSAKLYGYIGVTNATNFNLPAEGAKVFFTTN